MFFGAALIFTTFSVSPIWEKRECAACFWQDPVRTIPTSYLKLSSEARGPDQLVFTDGHRGTKRPTASIIFIRAQRFSTKPTAAIGG